LDGQTIVTKLNYLSRKRQLIADSSGSRSIHRAEECLEAIEDVWKKRLQVRVIILDRFRRSDKDGNRPSVSSRRMLDHNA
jgi:hypothetical protein